MFKEGDRVKYVVDGNFKHLTLNKTYTVIDVKNTNFNEYILVTDDTNSDTRMFLSTRFILDIKYQRKQKIQKLCLKKEIE